MCQQIIQFCSGSTKPLVFAGSFLTLLAAIGLGYLACSAQSLVQDILAAAQSGTSAPSSLSYHLQLAASAYLILISVFACLAAHYEHKHSIRALAALTSLNFLLAVAAILLVPAGNSPEFANQFKAPLKEARSLYDFTQRPPQPASPAQPSQNTNQTSPAGGQSSSAEPKARQKRAAVDGASAPSAGSSSAPLNATTATKLWDDLQYRGCCGFSNYTEWEQNRFPKSCCAKPEEAGKEFICKAPDEQHSQACIAIIESVSISTKNMTLLLVLALIALANLYLANVTGISAYRTFHYNEASQNAYS